MADRHTPLVLIVSGPSGSGKSTLVKKLLELPGTMFSISCTTRPPRPSERDGEWYNFVSPEEFRRMVEQGEFLEHACVFGKHDYGTLRRWLEPSGIAAGEVFEITVAVSEAFSNAIEHAYAAADAQIEVDGTLNGENLSVSIRDWGQWRQPRGINRGRGLGLMRGLMSEVKVTPGSSGTTVQLHRRVHRVMSA